MDKKNNKSQSIQTRNNDKNENSNKSNQSYDKHQTDLVKNVVDFFVSPLKNSETSNDSGNETTQETTNKIKILCDNVNRDVETAKTQQERFIKLENKFLKKTQSSPNVTNNVKTQLNMSNLNTSESNMSKQNMFKQNNEQSNMSNLNTNQSNMSKQNMSKQNMFNSNMFKLKINTTKNKEISQKNNSNMFNLSMLPKMNTFNMNMLTDYKNITIQEFFKIHIVVEKMKLFIIQHSELNANEKVLLITILDHAPESNNMGYISFSEVLNKSLSISTIRRSVEHLKQVGFLDNITSSSRKDKIQYFNSLVKKIYQLVPEFHNLVPLSHFLNIANNLPFKFYNLPDYVCMYVCNNNSVYNNKHTYVTEQNESELTDTIKKQINDELIDIIFKAHLLGIDKMKLSENVLKELYKSLRIPDNIKNAKNWEKQMHIINTKNNLLHSIYYTLQQSNVKHPWKYAIKIYHEGLFENLTQEQKEELEQLLKEIQNLQDENYLYDEATKKEIINKISRFNMPVEYFERLNGPELRKEIIKYFQKIKQEIKIITEKVR